MSAQEAAGVTDRLALATLACLPDTTAARLRTLLDCFSDPATALEAVHDGRADQASSDRVEISPRLARQWAREADPSRTEALLRRRSTRVWLRKDPDFPIDAASDVPVLLFAEGSATGALRRRRVSVVGTRSASVHGLADAYELGRHLAEAGITVVSGMALGIDGSAHEGALDAGGEVVGVVATGLDIEYPRRNRRLYARVRRQGLLVSEVGFGVQPTPARFPVRNRIIAALADVVVVVEATAKGGARITAEHALDYGRAVLAMPGSRRNPAAAGCNALLADGAHPLLEPSDVLVALGLADGAGRARWQRQGTPPPAGDQATVLDALAGEPASNDDLLDRTGWRANRLALALAELELGRLIERAGGRWWPR